MNYPKVGEIWRRTETSLRGLASYNAEIMAVSPTTGRAGFVKYDIILSNGKRLFGRGKFYKDFIDIFERIP